MQQKSAYPQVIFERLLSFFILLGRRRKKKFFVAIYFKTCYNLFVSRKNAYGVSRPFHIIITLLTGSRPNIKNKPDCM